MTETILCECGAIIRGSSKDHAFANLKIHKQSRRHKELMKLKKEKESALNRKNNGSELFGEEEKSDGKNDKN